jgi:hypothetical protein
MRNNLFLGQGVRTKTLVNWRSSGRHIERLLSMVGRASLTLTAVLGAVAVTAPAGFVARAEGPCEAGTHAHAAKRTGEHGRAPLVIGDSTLILAAPKLGAMGIEADARGCRQFTAGVSELAHRRHAGTLPLVTVMALGANGPISSSAMARALLIVGPHRVLALVTARRSQASDRVIYATARHHRDRVLLMDWAAFSAHHPSWFAGDGLHVGDDGARAYARFIRRKLRPFIAQPTGLDVPDREGAARHCDPIEGRGGRRISVYVVSGDIVCSLAQRLVRKPPLRRISGWSFYDWTPLHDGPWTRVYARHDRADVVAAITRGQL